jgi:hypothetical protein
MVKGAGPPLSYSIEDNILVPGPSEMSVTSRDFEVFTAVRFSLTFSSGI